MRYTGAAMEKNSEAENEALKAQLDAIDWSVLEQIERKETVNERGVFAPLEAVETEEIASGAGTSSGNSASRRSGKEKSERFFWRGDRERVSDWTDRREHSISGFTGSSFLFQQLIRNLMDVTDEAGAYVFPLCCIS